MKLHLQIIVYKCIVLLKSRQQPLHAMHLSRVTPHQRPGAVHDVKLVCQWNCPINLQKIRLVNCWSHYEKVTGLIHTNHCPFY